ncbi:MAG: hypothetical protein J1E02_00900 [Coprobacter sp.]|nr:hypothetical protein [Coprobacter sp.]
MKRKIKLVIVGLTIMMSAGFTSCQSYDEMPPRIEGAATTRIVFPVQTMSSQERTEYREIRAEYEREVGSIE